MRYHTALIVLLALSFTGCAQQRAMQDRIDTLEARITELETRQITWPIDMNSPAEASAVDRPWWDPAPVWKPNYHWGPSYGTWQFPGLELNLSEETNSRLQIGPTYYDSSTGVSWSHFSAYLFHSWDDPRFQDRDQGVFGAIGLQPRVFEIAVIDPAPPLEMGTFRLPQDR